MKTILIADDESSFLASLSEGLGLENEEFRILTAENGKKAVAVLKSTPVDLVVTDLKMPVMDGFELLAYLSRKHPETPVIVMTAFGNPEVEERLRTLDFQHYLEKPLDFQELAARIRNAIGGDSEGNIQGVSLPAYLRLVELEQRSCTLKASSEGRAGHLHFLKGALIEAESGETNGEEAAREILSWKNATIEYDPTCRRRRKAKDPALNHLLWERGGVRKARNHSDGGKEHEALEPKVEGVQGPPDLREEPGITIQIKEEKVMEVQEKLRELAGIEGFAGAGVFTPTGESLALLPGDGNVNIQEIGVLANNVLRNAQKASLDMGTGRGQLVHVEAEHAHILVRCLNEGTDPLKSEPGKAHIHMVLVLKSDAGLGLAKLKVGKAVVALAEDFRV